MALIYIDRLIQRNNFLLTELNVHRVIVTAILLAAKFFDDAYYNNAYYAKVGGVLVSEMNGLEVDFLFRINFSLHVTPELFAQYRVELLSHSGLDSLSLPPQPQYMDQSMVPSQLQERETMTIQTDCLQQPLMTNPMGGLSFPVVTSQAPVSAPAAPQITPSPPAVMMGGAKPSVEDEIMAIVDQAALRSNLPNLFPNEFGFLQRANSLPVQANSYVNQLQNAQPQPFSAPAMMAMVPEMMNTTTDQFVILDNQVYQISTGAAAAAAEMVAQHQRAAAAAARVLDASDLIHHVHHNPAAAVGVGSHHHHHHHHHHVPGFVSREAAVSQRFAAAGHMVAGVSGGL